MFHQIVAIIILWKFLVVSDTTQFPPPRYPLNKRKRNIHIVTYNMNSLPCNLKPISEIEKYLLQYDIILLQECFTNIFNSKYYFLKRMNKYYHIYTDTHSIFTLKLESSGLAILSRFPILDKNFYSFEGLRGMDKLVDKGIMKTTIMIYGKLIDIYNTHFQDGDIISPGFCLHHLKKVISPIQRPTIIGGDFNMENIDLGGESNMTHLPTWETKCYDYFIVYDVKIKDSGICRFRGMSDHNASYIII